MNHDDSPGGNYECKHPVALSEKKGGGRGPNQECADGRERGQDRHDRAPEQGCRQPDEKEDESAEKALDRTDQNPAVDGGVDGVGDRLEKVIRFGLKERKPRSHGVDHGFLILYKEEQGEEESG